MSELGRYFSVSGAMTDFYKFLFINVFFIFGLPGCVSVPALPEAPGVFAIKGKVGIREGEEQFSASFLWLQEEHGFQIDLWGPLGQGRVQLVKKDAEIELRNARDEVLATGDVETVMREQLGWSLPIDVLPAWVQGRPLAGVASRKQSFDAAGHLTDFEQLGWRVELDRYQTHLNASGSHALPTRITATSGHSRIRLAVAEWQLGT